MKLQPNSTQKHEILSNTPSSEKETEREPSSKTLRQNWFTSSFTNRFATSFTKPVKPDIQENAHTEQPQTLAKRIRNIIRPKVLEVGPRFKAVIETPVLELDSIARPSRAQEMESMSKQPDRRSVSKKFGAKAKKYVICDEVESNRTGEVALENGMVDDGGNNAVDTKDIDIGKGIDLWKSGENQVRGSSKMVGSRGWRKNKVRRGGARRA